MSHSPRTYPHCDLVVSNMDVETGPQTAGMFLIDHLSDVYRSDDELYKRGGQSNTEYTTSLKW